MPKKIKMLVIPSDRTGVGYFRSVAPHSYIAEHYSDDFEIDIVYDLPKNLVDFFHQYDLIHIHKQLDQKGAAMNLIKFLGIPVIIDVDDYYKLGDHHPMALTAKKEKWHEPIVKHIMMADCVTTTTPIYAKELRKLNKRVEVLPNAIDPTVPQFAVEKSKSDKLRVGIICGSSHLHDLECLQNLVGQVADNVQILLCGFDTSGMRTIYYPDGKVERREIVPTESVWYEYEKILTNNFTTISQEHRDFLHKFLRSDDPFVNDKYRRMWTRDINEYATHYANVDVLLAPLKPCDFNAMKSQLKAIEAGFTHTALIAQNFGPYTIDLKHAFDKGGKLNEDGNALLVDVRKNHKDWVRFINKLAADKELLKTLQDRLYDTVKDTYSLDSVCKRRVEVYKKEVYKKLVENSKK